MFNYLFICGIAPLVCYSHQAWYAEDAGPKWPIYLEIILSVQSMY